MDYFRIDFTRVQTYDVTHVQNAGEWIDFTHVQTCYVTRVQSARECIALVQTLHMSKPVM